jgi:hypothetical protein
MEVKEDDSYEEMAIAYQCLEIARLNEVLKDKGIQDDNLRREICQNFFIGSGIFLDQGHFVTNGKKVYPEVLFSERQEAVGIEVLYMPANLFSFDEYAFGNIYWYFDEADQSIDEIEHGTY